MLSPGDWFPHLLFKAGGVPRRSFFEVNDQVFGPVEKSAGRRFEG